MYRSTSSKQSTRRRTRTRTTRKESVVGKLLLELIAMAAFWIIISVSRFEGGAANPGDASAPNSTTEFGTMITGLLADQLDRYQILPNR